MPDREKLTARSAFFPRRPRKCASGPPAFRPKPRWWRAASRRAEMRFRAPRHSAAPAAPAAGGCSATERPGRLPLRADPDPARARRRPTRVFRSPAASRNPRSGRRAAAHGPDRASLIAPVPEQARRNARQGDPPRAAPGVRHGAHELGDRGNGAMRSPPHRRAGASGAADLLPPPARPDARGRPPHSDRGGPAAVRLFGPGARRRRGPRGAARDRADRFFQIGPAARPLPNPRQPRPARGLPRAAPPSAVRRGPRAAVRDGGPGRGGRRPPRLTARTRRSSPSRFPRTPHRCRCRSTCGPPSWRRRTSCRSPRRDRARPPSRGRAAV